MNKHLLLSLLLIVLLQFTVADYCCMKDADGNFCTSMTEEKINDGKCTDANPLQTACSSTSYCKTGVCVSSTTGRCVSNVQKAVCENNSGTFIDGDIRDLPRCQVGCCKVARQATLKTSQECTTLGTQLGLKVIFDNTIQDEMKCVSSLNTEEEGACVTQTTTSRTCQRKTRAECGGEEGIILETGNRKNESSSKTFYSGYLCSATILDTTCSKQMSTVCENQDVYWKDSCDNLENIVYDNSKMNNDKYDTLSYNDGKIMKKPDDSATDIDGNCDYVAGTMCSICENKICGNTISSKISHTCKSTSCTYTLANKSKITLTNMESICITDEENWNHPLYVNENGSIISRGNGLDLPGSEYATITCKNGDIEVLSCGEGRTGICVQNTTRSGKTYAGCMNNTGSQCSSNKDSSSCLASNRMCRWLNGSSELFKTLAESISEIPSIEYKFNESEGICLPMYTTGGDTTSSGSSALCKGYTPIFNATYQQGGQDVDDWKVGWCRTVGWFCGESWKNPVNLSNARYYPNTDTKNNKKDTGKYLESVDWTTSANYICGTGISDCGYYPNIAGEYPNPENTFVIAGNLETNIEKIYEYISISNISNRIITGINKVKGKQI